MTSTIRHVLRAIRGGACSARDLTVFNDDTFIVSYPKSGNTWVRFLIANLLYRGRETTFANIERSIPDIYRHTNRTLMKITRPRILESHEYFDPRYKKVIYIIRDPRDISVSYYYYLKKVREISEGGCFSSFVDEFVRGRVDGFGSWGQHVGSWLWEIRNNTNLLLLKYEDLKAVTEIEAEKIVNFLGIHTERGGIKRSIEASSFKRMRTLEAQEPDFLEKSGKMRTRNDIAFIREGKVGGWQETLQPPDREKIESAWHTLMKEFGYLE